MRVLESLLAHQAVLDLCWEMGLGEGLPVSPVEVGGDLGSWELNFSPGCAGSWLGDRTGVGLLLGLSVGSRDCDRNGDGGELV